MGNKGCWRGQLDKEFGDHYHTLTEKPNLFIEANRVDGLYVLNMTNLAVLFIFENFNFKEWFQLTILQASSSMKSEPLLTYRGSSDIEPLRPLSLTPVVSEDVQSCQFPAVLIIERQEVISGLTSVLRFILKYSICKSTPARNTLESTQVLQNLLGFRGGCLAACAETSTWTRFCEVEMTGRMILDLATTTHKCEATSEVEIPEDLVRFEHHLAQPLKQSNNANKKILRRLRDSRQAELRNHVINHDYAEGGDVTLSDVILFPPVHVAIHNLGEDIFRLHIPKVTNWYTRIQKFLKVTSMEMRLYNVVTLSNIRDFEVKIPDVPQKNLSKSDPEVTMFKKREYTKQDDIDGAINFLQLKGIVPLEYIGEVGNKNLFDWNEVPPLIHPEGGNLPESRRVRKGYQLSSLLAMVKVAYYEKVSKIKEDPTMSNELVKIVDFCSGGGHLGILVAWSLPNAQVILVENNEESLRRAQDRIQKIGLQNIKFFQCNLTSYVGQFDIGMALHACGSATDLVLKKCNKSGAAFVVSPCCYGSIQNSHLLQYPRSIRFMSSGLSQSQYLVLAHSSDQTHGLDNAKTSQGYLCMRIIDSDRLAHFGELGYRIWLMRMIPETASPKNHILVGVPES